MHRRGRQKLPPRDPRHGAASCESTDDQCSVVVPDPRLGGGRRRPDGGGKDTACGLTGARRFAASSSAISFSRSSSARTGKIHDRPTLSPGSSPEAARALTVSTSQSSKAAASSAFKTANMVSSRMDPVLRGPNVCAVISVRCSITAPYDRRLTADGGRPRRSETEAAKCNRSSLGKGNSQLQPSPQKSGERSRHADSSLPRGCGSQGNCASGRSCFQPRSVDLPRPEKS